MQSAEEYTKVVAMGRLIGPETIAKVYALYQDEQDEIARTLPATAVDVPYGPDPRHQLDIYSPVPAGAAAPIMIWVHGGGFVKGNKSFPDNPFGANVGRFAARNGLLGVCINYRLAPAHRWPAGGEDVARAVAWLKCNAAQYGGDPERIILVGTSAGAGHCATFLQLHPNSKDVAGVALLSGVYGYAPLTDTTRDLLYFSPDPEEQLSQAAGPALEITNVPLFITCAQFDPERFQFDYLALMQRRLARHREMPHTQIARGHNHYSQPYHLGTSDTRLSDEILRFVQVAMANHPARSAI